MKIFGKYFVKWGQKCYAMMRFFLNNHWFGGVFNHVDGRIGVLPSFKNHMTKTIENTQHNKIKTPFIFYHEIL